MKNIIPLSIIIIMLTIAALFWLMPSASTEMADCQQKHSAEVCHHEIYN